MVSPGSASTSRPSSVNVILSLMIAWPRIQLGRTRPRRPLSPRGRGCEAMTYGRVHRAKDTCALDGATVSHSAELVRGHLFVRRRRPPHPPFGHLLPKGRRASAAPSQFLPWRVLLALELNLDEGVLEVVGVDDVVVHAGLARVRDAEFQVREALLARRRDDLQPAIAERH